MLKPCVLLWGDFYGTGIRSQNFKTLSPVLLASPNPQPTGLQSHPWLPKAAAHTPGGQGSPINSDTSSCAPKHLPAPGRSWGKGASSCLDHLFRTPSSTFQVHLGHPTQQQQGPHVQSHSCEPVLQMQENQIPCWGN
jgi:hypothetical protein